MKKTKVYDMAKIVTTILVVVAHATRMYTPDGVVKPINDSNFLASLTKYIYIFHMPLFVFLSGCVYGYCIECGKYGDNFKFVINKVKRLMIPYFVFGILYVAPIMQMLGLDKQGYVMYCIKGIGLSYNARHLWYLFALLWIFVFVMFIKKIIQKYPIACVIVSLVIHYIGYKVKLPFQMTEALRYQLFFVLGFVFNQKYESFYKVYVKGKIVGCVLPIMLLGVFVFNPNRLTNIIYAVIGILAIISLSVVLQESTKLETTALYNVLKKDAFGIYLFHPMIIYIVFYMLGEFDISPYFLSLLAIGISIIISIVLTEFIRKMKLKIIIGE